MFGAWCYATWDMRERSHESNSERGIRYEHFPVGMIPVMCWKVRWIVFTEHLSRCAASAGVRVWPANRSPITESNDFSSMLTAGFFTGISGRIRTAEVWNCRAKCAVRYGCRFLRQLTGSGITLSGKRNSRS